MGDAPLAATLKAAVVCNKYVELTGCDMMDGRLGVIFSKRPSLPALIAVRTLQTQSHHGQWGVGRRTEPVCARPVVHGCQNFFGRDSIGELVGERPAANLGAVESEGVQAQGFGSGKVICPAPLFVWHRHARPAHKESSSLSSSCSSSTGLGKRG